MMKKPSQVWICGLGRDAPDWVVERMTSGTFGADGSFEMDAGDGPVRVEKGFAVFEYGGHAYACPPKFMQDKLGTIVGDDPVALAIVKPAPAIAPKKSGTAASTKAHHIKFKPPIGAPCTPSNVPVDQLLVDDTYQRSIEGGTSQAAIKKYAMNWDWRLCMPLLGSRRNGRIYIIDGQHRLEAAKLRGDIPWLPVVLFDFDDPKSEAELFVAANKSRRPMSTLDNFHAAVAAGDEKAIAINDVVTDAGLVVGKNGSWQSLRPAEVIFVRGIARALSVHGREIGVFALGMIARAFDGQPLVGAGAIFDGLTAIIADGEGRGDPIEQDLMEVVLSEVGLPGWKEAADVPSDAGGEERNEAMQRALRAAYDEARGQ